MTKSLYEQYPDGVRALSDAGFIVEIDETYIGGLEKNRKKTKRKLEKADE
jgi:hypothetical protein